MVPSQSSSDRAIFFYVAHTVEILEAVNVPERMRFATCAHIEVFEFHPRVGLWASLGAELLGK